MTHTTEVTVKTKVRVRQALRRFGFEVRRLQGGEVVDPLPLISFWLNRLDYFRRRMDDVKSIDGDIVECGVYRGISLFMLAYWMMRSDHPSRHLFGCDSFEGFPPPVPEDQGVSQAIAGGHGDTSPERVRKFLSVSGIPDSFLDTRLTLVKGFLRDTLVNWDRPIALLHVDVDMYQSHWDCLDPLFPHVVPGGLILFDEYDDPRWPGATKAVDEFLAREAPHVKFYRDGDKCYAEKLNGVPRS